MWLTVSELEMLDMPRFNGEEGIQGLLEIGMIEWVCHVRPTHPHWEGWKARPFTSIVRNKW